MTTQTPLNGTDEGAGSTSPEALSKDRDPIEHRPFSWLDPHPIFVIILVGSHETPFGIQKDFLCSISRYFREHFHKGDGEERTIEHVVRLADTSIEVFAHVQLFLYTGNVFVEPDQIPTYDVLVGVWKLGHKLGIEGLCERTLEAMCEYKRITRSIPATPLLLQVWKDTPEGSSIRQLLLSWAAEYLRSSETRADFAKSLPQELLSELVIAMSSCDDFWTVAGPGGTVNGHAGYGGKHERESDDESTAAEADRDAPGGGLPPLSKRARYFESYVDGRAAATSEQGSFSSVGTPTVSRPYGKQTQRTSLPSSTKFVKRRSHGMLDMDAFTPSQKLKFCSHLLTRMLSGPGFWTRLVGPFREPVDPATAGIPDYFEKIKRPMDLSTIKANLESGIYSTPEEFATDMRQIFSNVYTYWNKESAIWALCSRLEATFEQKYSQMHKWLNKADGEDLN